VSVKGLASFDGGEAVVICGWSPFLGTGSDSEISDESVTIKVFVTYNGDDYKVRWVIL
jgi:hypothetical protein